MWSSTLAVDILEEFAGHVGADEQLRFDFGAHDFVVDQRKNDARFRDWYARAKVARSAPHLRILERAPAAYKPRRIGWRELRMREAIAASAERRGK